MNFKKSALGAALAGTVAGLSMAGEVEVLHYWTSGGEAAAVSVLRNMVEEEGHTWTDFSVAGGGGENAMTVLRARAVSGNPPSAAQIKGPEIQEWGDLGFLGNLQSVAEANSWDEVVPQEVASYMKYEGNYVAVPINVHRVNWMWINPEALEKAGAEVPTTLDELWETAELLEAAGIVPIAHSGQSVWDATTFESIFLAVAGPDMYNAAFVEHDQAALNSEEMRETFRQLRTMRNYTDNGAAGRDWNVSTAMVIRGEAAIQFMGDWAKGEFTAAGMNAGEDYLCAPFPGTSGQFVYNVDSMAMFQQSNPEDVEAQEAMARLAMSPEFQETFNQNKGSIPVRMDHDMSSFDQCAQDSMNTFKETSESGEGLVPSMGVSMATTAAIQGAIYDVVTSFYNGNMSPEDAAERLAAAVRSAN